MNLPRSLVSVRLTFYNSLTWLIGILRCVHGTACHIAMRRLIAGVAILRLRLLLIVCIARMRSIVRLFRADFIRTVGYCISHHVRHIETVCYCISHHVCHAIVLIYNARSPTGPPATVFGHL